MPKRTKTILAILLLPVCLGAARALRLVLIEPPYVGSYS